jgi:hypothetical protein
MSLVGGGFRAQRAFMERNGYLGLGAVSVMDKSYMGFGIIREQLFDTAELFLGFFL